MSLTFVKTYEVSEFKKAVNTSAIRAFKNPQGKGFFRYLQDDDPELEKTFPMTSKASLEATIADPVISLAMEDIPGSRERKPIYFMHPRTSNGYECIGTF